MDRKKKKVPGVPTRTRESVKDERFAQVLKNPIYRPVPRQEKKVNIDRRFQGMFNDERFKLKYKVDKRGRPIATATDENLKRYYNLSEEEDKEEEAKDGDKEVDARFQQEDDANESNDEDDEDSDVEGDEKVDNMEEEEIRGKNLKIDQRTREKLHSNEIDYARGEADFEDESSSDDDDSSAEEVEINMLDHDWGELDKDAERTEEGTRRLAICNMDWDRVRAVDLMVLLSSFLPPGGSITQVAIYPSEFGKERMAEEDKEGPRELREVPSVKKETVSDEETSDDDNDNENSEDEEGSQYHREKLRQYQLNRLKYYYAVAEFDSVGTAEKVYAECDGMEYESSAAKVDLRFIPDDVSFKEDTPKEVCQEIPDREKYRPRFFTTTALQQVKVDLTWDETDPLRKELTEKIFDPKEKVNDDDIRAYLATSSEDEDDEEEQPEKTIPEVVPTKGKKKQDAISKYKALLENIEEQEKSKKGKDVEMEITWGVGLKENTEKLVKKKLEEEEKKKRTPWEEMLDKRKEKRLQRKQEKKSKKEKGSSEDTDEDEEQPFSDDDVDVDMDDEFFKSELRENDLMKGSSKKSKSKKSKNKATTPEKDEETKKTDAELELLLMDEDDNKRHFSLKQILEEDNATKTKKKRKNKLKKKSALEKPVRNEDFDINLEDPRFSALFSNHHYNVDPSNPNFKRTKAMEKIIQEKWKKRDATAQPSTVNNPEGTRKRKLEETEDNGIIEPVKPKDKHSELSFLVSSIKRNTKNLKMNQKSGKKKSSKVKTFS